MPLSNCNVVLVNEKPDHLARSCKDCKFCWNVMHIDQGFHKPRNSIGWCEHPDAKDSTQMANKTNCVLWGPAPVRWTIGYRLRKIICPDRLVE